MHPATGIIDARNSRDILVATSRMLSNFWHDRDGALVEEPPVPGVVHSVARVQDALKTRALLGHDEEALDRLLGYLMVASLRGRQLARAA